MNLKDIINRPDNVPITEHEAYYIISEYVYIRKGKRISPVIDTRYGTLKATLEIEIMHHLLNHAIGWLRGNLK